jgi:hypothetical protein
MGYLIRNEIIRFTRSMMSIEKRANPKDILSANTYQPQAQLLESGLKWYHLEIKQKF